MFYRFINFKATLLCKAYDVTYCHMCSLLCYCVCVSVGYER